MSELLEFSFVLSIFVGLLWYLLSSRLFAQEKLQLPTNKDDMN